MSSTSAKSVSKNSKMAKAWAATCPESTKARVFLIKERSKFVKKEHLTD